MFHIYRSLFLGFDYIIKQLLNSVLHNNENYQGLGLGYLHNTNFVLDNSRYLAQSHRNFKK